MFADVYIWFSRSYCEDPSCTNDGGESFLNPSGNFVDGKRSIAGRGFELDPGYYTPATKLRKLETEDGSIHLVIAEDAANPIKPGDEIWSSTNISNIDINIFKVNTIKHLLYVLWSHNRFLI